MLNETEVCNLTSDSLVIQLAQTCIIRQLDKNIKVRDIDVSPLNYYVTTQYQ